MLYVMPNYQVLIAESVDKYLEKLDPFEKGKIISRLKKLQENPESVGEPRGKFWILKVGRSGYRLAYRIVYEEKTVMVTAIEQRKSWKYDKFYQ